MLGYSLVLEKGSLFFWCIPNIKLIAWSPQLEIIPLGLALSLYRLAKGFKAHFIALPLSFD